MTPSDAEPSPAELAARLAQVTAERDALLGSTSWRATWPLRALAAILRSPRRPMHRGSSPPSARPEAPQPVIARRMPEQPALDHRTLNQAAYTQWIAQCERLDETGRANTHGRISRLAWQPLISVVMPTYQSNEAHLRAAIESVRAQLYPVWELCIADDASPDPGVARVLADAAAEDTRIRWVRRAVNGHVSAASNTALDLAQGSFVALLDHDDVLAETALFRVATLVNDHADADIIFSDEDRLHAAQGRHAPYLKPAWDPDLMLGQNAVNHLGVYRRSLLARIGGFREGLEGAQDHDLALRAAAASEPARIHHIPAVLYHWRGGTAEALSAAQLQRCIAASRRAVQEHVSGLPGGADAGVAANPRIAEFHRVHWPLPAAPPRVSVLAVADDGVAALSRRAAGVLCTTDYPDIELILPACEGESAPLLRLLARDSRVRVIEGPRDGAPAAWLNAAASQASGTVLVLLDDSVEPLDAGWLKELAGHALRPDIATVGARLLTPDHHVHAAGLVLGYRGIAGSPGQGLRADEAGYAGHLALVRSVSANSAACMAMRRDLFVAAGGLDAVALPRAWYDVDLCLRLADSGRRHIWTPFAELLCRPAPPPSAEAEEAVMRARWGDRLAHDPSYNINFARDADAYRLTCPPKDPA